MEKRTKVLLLGEGTYPFNTGGVSTWAHSLCTKLKNVDFYLYSINAGVESKTKYSLSDNVKKIIQIPMWSPEEPFDCIDYDVTYSSILMAKEITSEALIGTGFTPHFRNFIEVIYSKNQDVNDLNLSIYGMWRFFQKYDYKTTMTSETVWNSLCESLKKVLPKQELKGIHLMDMTTALRWIYRFLIPIAINVPKVDVSHVTISGVAILPALSLKYKYNTPILVTEHGVFIRERMLSISSSDFSFFLKKILIKFSECITRLVYFHASRITTVSKFNMAWEKFYGADPEKIEVIHNGVDHLFFKPLKKPHHLTHIPTVVAAARIFELKDILTMIRVCHKVKEVIPNVQFLVYGNKDAVPNYTEKCEKLVTELGLEDSFILKGFHNKPELLYSEGDVSILTSISEGFPYTVLESMSCGVPVVATDVGGVCEALDETCGFICKPRDYNEIAEKVISLLKNQELRNWMGENAREKVKKLFTINTFVEAFSESYANITNKKVSLVEGNR